MTEMFATMSGSVHGDFKLQSSILIRGYVLELFILKPFPNNT